MYRLFNSFKRPIGAISGSYILFMTNYDNYKNNSSLDYIAAAAIASCFPHYSLILSSVCTTGLTVGYKIKNEKCISFVDNQYERFISYWLKEYKNINGFIKSH